MREALQRPRGVRPGLEAFARLVFQGNAIVAIIVLALIAFTVFRDAVGFLPQNHRNLVLYRQAGLEMVDLLKRGVDGHRSLVRYLAAAGTAEAGRLAAAGLDPAAIKARLAPVDDIANRLADAIGPQEAILGEMTEAATALKERAKVATDLTEARQHLLAAGRNAPPARAAELQRQAAAMVIEQIDFKQEIQPLLARRPEIAAANAQLAGTLQGLATATTRITDPALQAKLRKFRSFLDRYTEEFAATGRQLAAWDQDKPVRGWETFTAFAFGRDWVTASFWQDWFGILPLFTGSLLIAFLALCLAIPLGVAAAIYVNQIATPLEQHFIKPYIEFISAIPSVVLGFFGIAVLGETLRRLSQLPALDWVPGFPFAERLNAGTAACLLALTAIPTIFSLAEDALNNVPRSFREASLALGATRLQTIVRITVPSALSGITAAVLLGFGRVIGETMIVLLCAGNRIEIPDFRAGPGVVFQPVHTMTGIIAQEMGEVVHGSIHYRALFMVGAVLFLISLLVNWLALKIVRRYRLVSI